MGSDRLEKWWELAGPVSLLDKIAKAIAKAERVVVVECPDPRPDGLGEALDRHLGRELALETISVDVSGIDQNGSIAHLLCEAAGIPTAEISQVEDFATHSALADKVLLIDGIDRAEIMRWSLFLRSLAGEKIPGTIVGPVVVLLVPRGLTANNQRTLKGRAFSCSTLGRVTRNDTIAHLARIGIRPGGDVVERIAHAVCVDVAGWSRPMLETMVTWDLDDQIDPSTVLRRLADNSSPPFPCWENGLVDLWDDEPVAHPVAAYAHGLVNHVRRRIWTAQATIVLPLADRIRRGLIGRYRELLDRRVSPENPYIRNVNGHEKVRTDPLLLEFYEIRTVLADVLTPEEINLIRVAKNARDCGAHMEPILPQLIHRLSEHYEANREILECEIPGWDWPRVGQTMTLTIGPSAAGKSSWAKAQGLEIVSSDAICEEIYPSGEAPSDEAGVCQQVRSRASRILLEGRDVIVDATHLKAEQRKRRASITPPDLGIRYVIIDRPLPDKLKAMGWRSEKLTIEHHHNEFSTAIDEALIGDKLINVRIEDLRQL